MRFTPISAKSEDIILQQKFANPILLTTFPKKIVCLHVKIQRGAVISSRFMVDQ